MLNKILLLVCVPSHHTKKVESGQFEHIKYVETKLY